VEELIDATHEGGGDRMMTIWKYLLLYSQLTGHRKYAYESVNITGQASSPLSEWSAHRLKWWGFVNTTGKLGKNHP